MAEAPAAQPESSAQEDGAMVPAQKNLSDGPWLARRRAMDLGKSFMDLGKSFMQRPPAFKHSHEACPGSFCIKNMLLPDIDCHHGQAMTRQMVRWYRDKMPTAREQRGDPARVFMAGQQTAMLQTELRKWLDDSTWAPGYASAKASLPPFNQGPDLLPGTIAFNVPVFGPLINEATVSLFAGDAKDLNSKAMREIAGKLILKTPRYKLSDFVQKKLASGKVTPLVEAAKKLNEAAAQRVETFVKRIAELDPKTVKSSKDWKAVIKSAGIADGWESRLHFDVLLQNFGFDAPTAQRLRRETIPDNGETKTLETYSMRWLGKAFTAFQPDGCLADVVNLVVAMTEEKPPKGDEASEQRTVDRLVAFKERLDAAAVDELARKQEKSEDKRKQLPHPSRHFRLAGLPPSKSAAEKCAEALRPNRQGDADDAPDSPPLVWLPTHLQLDCELDDSLSWMLLRRVHDLLESVDLKVLVQLPGKDEKDFDPIQQRMLDVYKVDSLRTAVVFRDPDSKNAAAVRKQYVFDEEDLKHHNRAS